MDSSPNCTISPSSNSNIYHISGVPVKFPYKPYGSQLAFMSRVISTLDRARKQGHCHALLESPTGTGKTLSLLCSSLAWQQYQIHRSQSMSHSIVSQPLEVADPLLQGGGFIPDPDPSGNFEKLQQATKSKNQKKLSSPIIFYASRTHSQISQVIREYKKTSYRVPMSVLASRKHYCTNKLVCGKDNVNELCKLLLKDSSGGCLEFKNASKVKSHPSLQMGGCLEVHDIEDLVTIGERVKGCSYFAAQSLTEEAQLVFCPYSYIINPVVRRAMDIDIKGCILILDEAHNIEDMARDGGSVDIEEDVLLALQAELGQLCINDNLSGVYRPLYEVIEGIVGWINLRKDNLQKCEFEHYLSHWTGEKATQELKKAGISQQYFPVLQECASKAIKEASDAEPGETLLTGASLINLEGLFSALSYFFAGNGCHVNDYQLALRRYVKRDLSNEAGGWTITMSLWCLNPAVVFKDIADLSLSVILTSGTLSPLGSFSSELGIRFETCMEAPHVINTESQLWAAAVSSGVGDIPLNASYKSADSYAFQDSLGATLEEICKVVPGGALVFFPSYKLLDKLHARWSQTGQWSKLNAQKDLFIEPRGSASEFDSILKGYYDAISGKRKPAKLKNRNSLKKINKHSDFKDPQQNLKSGAAFLAVFRGKVSEGIDFSDDNARVVVIVGIPFPNINDIQVNLKKRFNDTYKSSKNLLSGSEWYCHQAFRALNQAAGRCIRHKLDYGAIILLDERYKEQRNLVYLSKWLKSSLRLYKNFDESLEGLQSFFRDTKVLEQNSNVLTEFNTSKENLQPPKSLNIETAWKENKKIEDFSNHNEKIDSIKKPHLQINQFIKGNDRSPVFQPQTPGNCSDVPMVLDDDEDVKRAGIMASYRRHQSGLDSEDIGILSVTPDKFASGVSSNSEEGCLTVLQIPETPISHFDIGSNGFVSKESRILSYSPENFLSPVYSNGKDPNFVQKKRRLKVSPNCSEMDCSNACSNEFDGQLLKNIDRRIEFMSEDDAKVKLDLFKSKYQYAPSPIFSDERELLICCSSCKKSLGLPENKFLIKGVMMLSSKAYLSCIRTDTSSNSFTSERLLKTRRDPIHVLSSDTMFINEQIINGRSNTNVSNLGVWCEEDGCVFRTIFCSFCLGSDTCLGVHVLATDAPNANLLNKVLFYADRVCISESKALNENSLQIEGNSLCKCSDHVEKENTVCKVPKSQPDNDSKQTPAAIVQSDEYNRSKPLEIERFAYKPQIKTVPDQNKNFTSFTQPKTSNFLTTSRSKLKLPRKL